jgi:hypothetical protein
MWNTLLRKEVGGKPMVKSGSIGDDRLRRPVLLVLAIMIATFTGCAGEESGKGGETKGKEEADVSKALERAYYEFVQSHRRSVQIDMVPYDSGRTVASVSKSAAVAGLGRILSVATGGYIDRGPLDREHLIVSTIQPIDKDRRPIGAPILLANVSGPLVEGVEELNRAVQKGNPLVYYIGMTMGPEKAQLVNVDQSVGQVFYAVEPFPVLFDIVEPGAASPLSGTDELPPSTSENLAPLQRLGLNVKKFVAVPTRR